MSIGKPKKYQLFFQKRLQNADSVPNGQGFLADEAQKGGALKKHLCRKPTARRLVREETAVHKRIYRGNLKNIFGRHRKKYANRSNTKEKL